MNLLKRKFQQVVCDIIPIYLVLSETIGVCVLCASASIGALSYLVVMNLCSIAEGKIQEENKPLNHNFKK